MTDSDSMAMAWVVQGLFTITDCTGLALAGLGGREWDPVGE